MGRRLIVKAEAPRPLEDPRFLSAWDLSRRPFLVGGGGGAGGGGEGIFGADKHMVTSWLVRFKYSFVLFLKLGMEEVND